MNIFVITLVIIIGLLIYAAVDPVIYKNDNCYVLYYFNYKGQRKEIILWRF